MEVTPLQSRNKQDNFLLNKWQRHSMSGKVTLGLAECSNILIVRRGPWIY